MSFMGSATRGMQSDTQMDGPTPLGAAQARSTSELGSPDDEIRQCWALTPLPSTHLLWPAYVSRR